MRGNQAIPWSSGRVAFWGACGLLVGSAGELGMAKGFRPVVRDQPFLLPPDMRDWLPREHLVWFVIAVVEKSSPVGCPSLSRG